MADQRARDMRKSMTPQEVRLWAHLRRLRRLGHHFRRQAPFRGYYLDFVCHKARLVVEVDGSHHLSSARADRDAVRDAVLAEEGFRTLRVGNNEVNTNIEAVIETILALLPVRPS